MSLTKEEVLAQHPEAAAALRADGADAAALAERQRIQSIEAQSLPGHEALVSALKFDGKSTAGDAALAILGAQRKTLAGKAEALKNEAPAALPGGSQSGHQAGDQQQQQPQAPRLRVPDGFSAVSADGSRLDAAAKAYQAKNAGTSYIAAVKAVQATQGA